MAKKAFSSYLERMTNNNYRVNEKVAYRPYKKFKTVERLDERTGKIVRKNELVTVDRQDEMKAYRCSDFALENLLAVGANLTPVTMQGSIDSSIDNIANKLESLSQQVSSNNNE